MANKYHIEISLENLVVSSFNVRKNLETDDEETNIDDLAKSMAENGLINAINVRPLHDGTYEIYAGQRRYLAAKKLGWSCIQCYVSNLDDNEAELNSLLENVQRSNMTYADKCRAYLSLYEKSGENLDKMCEWTGVTKQTLKKYINIGANLDPRLLNKLNEKGEDKLTIGVAEKLAVIPKSLQHTAIQKLSDSKFNNKSKLSIIGKIERETLSNPEKFNNQETMEIFIDQALDKQTLDIAEDRKVIIRCECGGVPYIFDEDGTLISIPPDLYPKILRLIKSEK